MQHTTAEPSSNRLRHRRQLLIPLKLLAIPLLGLVVGYYLKENGYWLTVMPDASTPQSPAFSGLPLPVVNTLSADYADTDGDLVADAPSDKEHLVNPAELAFSPGEATGEVEAAELWQPLLTHIEKVTGKPAKLREGLEDQVQRLISLRDGKCHVALFDAGMVPKAVNTSGFVPIAKSPGAEGNGVTQMVLIVPAESAAREPKHLRGLQFTFVDPDSNTGFKAAVATLRSDFSLKPGRDFTWRFSGSHQASIQAIKEQRAWMAAVDKAILGREVSAGRIATSDYRMIYESEAFPTAAIGYAHNLDPEVARKLREALISFDWKGSRLESVLGGGMTRFLPIDYKLEWAQIRKLDDATGTKHVIEAEPEE